MGRKFSVEKLPLEQKDFVMHKLLDGLTDDEILAEVKAEFDIELARSSFNRWRKTIGETLAERFKLKRFLVRSFVEKLKKEGIPVKEDKYQQVIENLEEHLLTSERELISQNPTQLLLARQREEHFRLKREQLELKREELAFEREKLRGAAIDRPKLGVELMGDLFEYLGDDGEGILFIKKHTKPFSEFLKKKYAAEES